MTEEVADLVQTTSKGGPVKDNALQTTSKGGSQYDTARGDVAGGVIPAEPVQLGPSVVRLFGTVFNSVSAEAFQPGAAASAQKNMLVPNPTDDEKAPKLARIYGFSVEGRYVPLQPPALFLVHGLGVAAPDVNAPDAIETLGFVQKPEAFMPGFKVWAYDRNEVTSRIDYVSGTLQDLLGPALVGFPGSNVGRPDIMSGQDGAWQGRFGAWQGRFGRFGG